MIKVLPSQDSRPTRTHARKSATHVQHSFFPISMPDETLLSRITRYHFLSGNKTEAETFRDLFGVAPFQLSIIPKQLENLASRLPGVKENNLAELLAVNTYVSCIQAFYRVIKRPI